jgi:NAD-dependent SIR2 family protein deacetylase
MKDIKEARKFIKDADALLITAGAGMGVDSGLPDFRGNEGFWKAYPPIKKLGLSFSDMANPAWFDSDPLLAWAFYGHRLNLYRDTVPHDGFKMLLDLVKEKDDNYFVFTSNVDGQFQKAGFSDEKIYEVHGSIHHLQCAQNCTRDIWENKESIEVDMDRFIALDTPTCPKCNSISRPNILMFGDWGWNGQRSSDQEHRYAQWLNENRDKKIAIIEVGAGTAVPTVRMEGEHLAMKEQNMKLIRINPREYIVNNSIGFSIPLGGEEGIRSII